MFERVFKLPLLVIVSTCIAETFCLQLAPSQLFLGFCSETVIFTIDLPFEIDKGFIFVRLAELKRTSRITCLRWIRPPWANRCSRLIIINTLSNSEFRSMLWSQKFWCRQKIIYLKLYLSRLNVAYHWRSLNNFERLGFSVGFQPKIRLINKFRGPRSLQVRVSLDNYRVGPLLNYFLCVLSLKLILVIFKTLLQFTLSLFRILPLQNLLRKSIICCALIELIVNMVNKAAHDNSRLRFYPGGVDLRLEVILLSVKE